jgi:hypothetical protein
LLELLGPRGRRGSRREDAHEPGASGESHRCRSSLSSAFPPLFARVFLWRGFWGAWRRRFVSVVCLDTAASGAPRVPTAEAFGSVRSEAGASSGGLGRRLVCASAWRAVLSSFWAVEEARFGASSSDTRNNDGAAIIQVGKTSWAEDILGPGYVYGPGYVSPDSFQHCHIASARVAAYCCFACLLLAPQTAAKHSIIETFDQAFTS